LKPAVLRPQALRDQQGEVRYYRKEGGTRVAVKLANATNAALDQIELDPGIGSPTLGKLLGIRGPFDFSARSDGSNLPGSRGLARYLL